MDLTDPGDPELLSVDGEMISAHSAKEKLVKDENGSKKDKWKRGSREQAEATPARVQRPKSNIETLSAGFYFNPSLLGVWCACAGLEGPVVPR
jgi:hypothetical protein